MSDTSKPNVAQPDVVELKVGDQVPAWSGIVTQAEGEQTLSAESLRGEAYILYFYPKDNTPGCTTQACDFRDQSQDQGQSQGITSLGYRVIGCSPDSVKSHHKFQAKYELPFELLSDPDHEVATQFGVWREKKNYGRTYMGIVRSTFVVNAEGVLTQVMINVRAKGHVERLARTLAE